jgi:ankyrin repeat protein
LLGRGADLNAVDTSTGCTPLFNAASWGRAEVVELLLAKGANPALRTKSGQSPAAAADENGHDAIAAKLKHALAESRHRGEK